MDSLIVRAVVAVMTAAVRGDDTPGGPSGPVEIGTNGTPHSRSEIGSWQTLILMFIAAIVVGAAVLMYVVRQRGKLVERRRLRRMAEAMRLADEASGAGRQIQPEPRSGPDPGPRVESRPDPSPRPDPAPRRDPQPRPRPARAAAASRADAVAGSRFRAKPGGPERVT